LLVVVTFVELQNGQETASGSEARAGVCRGVVVMVFERPESKPP
jgi:hypothetical protein